MALLDFLGLGSLTQAQPLSSTPTSVSTQTQQIPAFAQPYVEDILGRSYALTTQTPYMPYAGERVAGFTPLQQKAFGQLEGMGVAPQIGQATDLAGQAGRYGLGAFGQYTQAATDPGAIKSYMSPYMQNVVDWQKQQAIMDFNRQMPYMQAQAVGAGAYGGSRQAVQQAEAQRNLQNTLAGIQATGTQNAYEQALKNMQYGAGLGIQGAQLGSQAAGQIGQLGQLQFGQQMGINTALQQAGAQQQMLEQQRLQNAYQDYLTQLQYPYQQLQFQKGILSGLPGIQQGTTTQTGYQSAAPVMSQLAGLGGLALGAYGLANKKEGGEIRGYAEGGIVGGGVSGLDKQVNDLVKIGVVNPTRLSQYLQDPKTRLAAFLAKGIVDRNRQAVSTQQAAQLPEQPPVLDQLALASLPVSGFNFEDRAMASGGIVAFAGEDDQLVRGGMDKNDVAYWQTAEQSFPVQAGRYLGAGITDLIRMPGRVAWDWDHYKRTGERKRNYQTEGFFPVSTGVPERTEAAVADVGTRAVLPKNLQASGTMAAPGYFGTSQQYAAQAQPQTQLQTQLPARRPGAGTGITAALPAPAVPATPAPTSQAAIAPASTDAVGLMGMGIAEKELEIKRLGEPTLEDEVQAENRARERAGITGKLGEEREKTLRETGQETGKRKDEAKWLSIIDASLGILRASKPGETALSALGGAAPGVQRYVSMLDKIRAEEAERDKELAGIQNLRRAEELGVVSVARGTMERKQARVDALRKSALDMKVKVAELLASDQRLSREIAARTAQSEREIAARAEISRLDREAQMVIAKLQASNRGDLGVRMLEELRAAEGDVEKVNAIKKRYESITNAIYPQRTEQPMSPLLRGLPGVGGGQATSGFTVTPIPAQK